MYTFINMRRIQITLPERGGLRVTQERICFCGVCNQMDAGILGACGEQRLCFAPEAENAYIRKHDGKLVVVFKEFPVRIEQTVEQRAGNGCVSDLFYFTAFHEVVK